MPERTLIFGGRLVRKIGLVLLLAFTLVPLVVLGARGADATTVAYDSEETQFLGLINEYRANNGIGTLILSDTLAVAAERHNEDMSRYDFFAHDTERSSYYPAGSEPWDRMAAEGYRYDTFRGENLAVGYETAEEAFQAWRESPSHNEAMLDGNYKVMGVSRIQVPGSRYEWYWTTDFGAVKDPSSHAPGAPSRQQAQQQARQTEQPTPQGSRAGAAVDRLGIENGVMDGRAAWEQRAKDGAALISSGTARLGGYDDGVDNLRQKLKVPQNARLSFNLRVTTAPLRDAGDRLAVRLTDAEGKSIVRLASFTASDKGGWRRETADLSRYAGQTVYLSFRAETDARRLTSFYVDNVKLLPAAR